MKTKESLHIIIDGCDSVGKTTLCANLSQALDIPVTHMEKAKEVFTTRKTCDIETLSYMYNHTLVQLKEHSFIIDRGYVSSLVYTEVYERPSNKVAYIKDIERALNPVVYILVNQDIDTLKARGDEVVPVADFGYIQSTYEVIAKNRRYAVIDVTDLTPLRVFERVMSDLEKKGAICRINTK